MKTMSRGEAETMMQLALGRLFKLGSRPTQPGDVDEWHKIRSVVLECGEVLGVDSSRPVGHESYLSGSHGGRR